MTVPNLLTLLRIALTPLFITCLLEGHLTLAFIVFVVAGITDGLDGFIARTFNQRSTLGAYLDPIADKILLTGSTVVFAWLNLIPLGLAFIIVSRDMLIIFGACLLIIFDAPFEVRPSITGKLTTLSQIIMITLVMVSKMAKFPEKLITLSFYITAVFTIISGVQYFRRWQSIWLFSNCSSKIRNIVQRKLNKIWYSKPPKFFVIFNAPSIPYLFFLSLKHKKYLAKSIRPKGFVISVGNLTVGGNGKTPFVIWLAEKLNLEGYKVSVVCKSIGKGAIKEPARVELEKGVNFYGDEPFLIASKLKNIPVWVAKSKAKAILAMEQLEPSQVIVIDDGFQHWLVERDIDIVLFDGRRLVGNGMLLPFGPLREPLKSMARADIIIFIGDNKERFTEFKNRLKAFVRKDTKFIMGSRIIEEFRLGNITLKPSSLRGLRLFAFSSIADPESFFKDLEKLNLNIVGKLGFNDHHLYTPLDIKMILEEANKKGAHLIVTTEKDFVKMPEDVKPYTGFFTMTLTFEEEAINKALSFPSFCLKSQS